MINWLCNVAHALNGVYGGQLLVSSCFVILTFLAQSYFLYMLGTRSAISHAVIKFVAIIFWLSGEVLELYVLLKTCTDACDNANDIAVALHEIQNTVENTELESDIQIYSLQMLHQKINFSALGFFEVDFSLFYAIVGTVLTFLVIVVQYDQAEFGTKPVTEVTFLNYSEIESP